MTNTVVNLHEFQFCSETDLESSCIKEIKTTIVGDWFLFYAENVDDGYEFLRQNAEKHGHLQHFLEYNKNDLSELRAIKKPEWYGWYNDLILPLDRLISIRVVETLESAILNLKTLGGNEEFKNSFKEDFKRLIDMYNFWAPRQFHRFEKLSDIPKNDIQDLEILSEILFHVSMAL